MDEPRGDTLSKSERERPVSYGISHMWNLKKMLQMNLFTKQKETHRHRSCKRLTYSYLRGKRRRDNLGVWDEQIHTTIHKIDNQQIYSK